MKGIILSAAIATITFASCKPYQAAIPTTLQNNADKYHVKGTSVSVFGHKIKIDGFGEAKMYSGFTTRNTTDKRLFPLYFDLDKRMNYISNHFSKEIHRTRTKYHFDFVSNDIYANTYCVAKATESSLSIKNANMNISLNEDYSFEGLIFTNKETNPWKLTFNGNRDIKKGLGDYLNNTRQTDGVLSNDVSTIDVKLVTINGLKNQEVQKPSPFAIGTGYEFRKDNEVVGYVNLFDRDIWVSKAVDAHTKVILVSAATSILVKANAS
jgi:hypothetical protein